MLCRSHKKRVVYLISEFVHGSKVRQLIELIQSKSDEFDVHVAALELGDEAMSDVLSTGVDISHIRFMPPKTFSLTKWWQFILFPFRLAALKPHLVHSLCYQSHFVDAFVIKYILRSKYVYTKTNLQWDNHPINWKIRSLISDSIVSLSGATDKLLSRHGFESKTVKIPLGIDVNRYLPGKKKRGSSLVVGCASQILQSKNILKLIDAFQQVLNSPEVDVDVRLVICGRGYDDKYYRRFLSALSETKPQGKVFYLGVVSDMVGFYQSVDIFVLPTIEETFGYVFIEAMACSLPVICCDIDGPNEIIVDGYNGMLLRSDFDTCELADAIKKYVNDTNLLAEHSNNARSTVEAKFTNQIMSDLHWELYKKVLVGSE